MNVCMKNVFSKFNQKFQNVPDFKKAFVTIAIVFSIQNVIYNNIWNTINKISDQSKAIGISIILFVKQ